MSKVSEKHYHILGSCGTLMAGLCQLAHDYGLSISGSDRKPSLPMSALLPPSCTYLLSDKKYLDADCVVVGNVFKFNSDEIIEIRKQGIPIISSMDFLSIFLEGKRVIAVCGTHGKSTITSIVSWILECAELKPSYLIGAQPSNFKQSARYVETSNLFVIEADEYDISFFDKRSKMQTLWPEYILVSTIEYDHADIFDSFDQVVKAFDIFMRRLSPTGKIIALKHLPRGLQYHKNIVPVIENRLTYSHDHHSSYVALGHTKVDSLVFGPVPSNLQLAYTLAKELKVSNEAIELAIASFKGVVRRAEKFFFKEQCFWVDFAHHPSSISAFLSSLDVFSKKCRYVLIEKASNSMVSGAFDEQLNKVVQSRGADQFYWMDKEDKSDKTLRDFVNLCIDKQVSGIILTNNPYRWSQIQCVFSMHSPVE